MNQEPTTRPLGSRLGAFAPGSYFCKCMTCGEQFMGDKRATACLNCAIDAVNHRVNKMSEALGKIERWELPPSGVFYPNADGTPSDRPAPYDSFFAEGVFGGQRYIRNLAKEAQQ